MDSEEIGDGAFLELVRDRQWLYDTQHKKYMDSQYKDNTWTNIAEAMGFEDDEDSGETKIEQCKKRWKRLRDNFWRVHKKMTTPSGSGAKEGKIWGLYESLKFLLGIKTKATRKTTSNFKVPVQKKIQSTPSEKCAPTEKWDSVDDMFISTSSVTAEAEESFEQPAQLSPASAESASSSSPLPFEDNDKKKKRPAPQRVNPNPDEFARKKKASSAKFEELLSKGFDTFNTLVAQQTGPAVAETSKASANHALMNYIVMELEEMSAENQKVMRKAILESFNAAKDKLN